MKKIIQTAGILFLSVILSNCGNSKIEEDAKKLAILTCKASKLAKDRRNTEALNECKKLNIEAANLSKECVNKYQSSGDALKFGQAFTKAYKECN